MHEITTARKKYRTEKISRQKPLVENESPVKIKLRPQKWSLLKPRNYMEVGMKPKMTAISASEFLNVTVQAVHKQLKTKGLDYEKSNNRVHFGHETAKKLLNLNFGEKARVIAVEIVKGGPGKTTLVKNLGIRTALYGGRVLLIDTDQQGNLTNDFLKSADEKLIMADLIENDEIPIEDAIVNVFPGLDIIPSRLDNTALDKILMIDKHPLDRVYKDRIEPLRQKYDLIIFDCPPSIGASVTAAALASDLVIAPVAPEKYCLDGLKMTLDEIEMMSKRVKVTVPVKIVVNKFDNRTSLSSEILKALHTHNTYSPLLYKTFIRHAQEFINTTADRVSIYDSLRVSTAQQDFDQLTREILDLDAQRPKKEHSEEISLGSLDQGKNKLPRRDERPVETSL